MPTTAFKTAIYPVRIPEAAPFVKWVGGKRSLLPQIMGRIPQRFNAYHEPFVGGGAVFFALQPVKARLSDDNGELVTAYQVIRDDVERLIRHLRTHRVEAEYFYDLRAKDPSRLDPVERASRLIYLNRTCFNGLYRVNSRGGFNVPFGRYKNPLICNEAGLRAASLALSGTAAVHAGYEAVLDQARRGDFVYFDPPYHPVSATANFTGYTAGAFGERDQRRLADVYRALHARGCKVMLSNSDTSLIHELYGDFNVEIVAAPRLVNRDATKRGPVNEVLVRNYRS
ncbi:MAG: DNA adenine methylase [Candidatus Sericytochromatia bacterium]|nr:DNA adenine methylase [Candidatus Sericytochromatia bacterium]